MNLNQKRYLTGALLGLVIVYFGFGLITSKIKARRYEQIFLQLNHPQGTLLVDSISTEFSYYPATYVAAPIHFKSAHLIGELRSYGASWGEIKDFYGNQSLEGGGPVAVIPIEVHKRDEQVRLDVPDAYVGNPSEYEIISAIQEQYNFWGSSKSINNIRQNLYLVYCLWQ